ncbi:MAG: alkaline phosphatase D family protein, partial [Sandaracinaceae bacterium]
PPPPPPAPLGCGCGGAHPPASPLGVACGPPPPDAVILWTRVAPDEGGGDPVEVTWEIGTTPGLANLQSGTVTTGPDRDYTVKVDVTGLAAGTTYYYRFTVGSARSALGRTKTLPEGSTDRLRLAFCSCSNYPGGYFHAYRAIGERADLDVVLHLGDYTYEYAEDVFGDGSEIGRAPDPDAETVMLDQYRRRLAQYRSDPDLQEAHRQHPWIVVWDDHEIANDAWTGGAENHDPDTQGSFGERRDAALQAYFEWLPIRPQSTDRREIFRGFTFGDLVDLSMLETRLIGRDVQPLPTEDPNEPTRQLLGAEQEEWLLARLRNATAQWKLVGQQTKFTRLAIGSDIDPLFYDSWSGYRGARQRILEAIEADGIEGVAVLTGDIHASLAADLAIQPLPQEEDPTYDPQTGDGSLAVEIVAPAVSSPSLGDQAREQGFPAEALLTLVLNQNPQLKYLEIDERGYVLLDIDAARLQAEWWHTGNVREEAFSQSLAIALRSDAGTNRLVEADGASEERSDAPRLAP